ncbi:MAG: DUF805 domain-containing protein [Rhodobacteraceae bacterium]|nr:DUF805 domain-containing protein [Paracoccaceae bacterium]
MTFGNAIKTCFRKYFTFSGSASRSEFWWFYALSTLGVVGPSVFGIGQLGSLVWIGTITPFLAVSWRRMHDCGNGGAPILLPFAVQVCSVYAYLFSQLRAMMPALSDIEVSLDMTLRELQELQAAAVEEHLVKSFSTAGILPAALVFTIGFAWMVYLLVRPSQEGENHYGPNPHEVTT